MTAPPAGDGGFVAFFRRYTKTWLHGVSTAALTAFGALAVLHRGFVAVAIAAYVLPPVVVYATGRTPSGRSPGASPDGPSAGTAGRSRGVSTERRPAGSEARPPRAPGEAASDRSGRRPVSGSDPDARTEPSSGTDSDAASRGRWTTVDSPTGAALHDVAAADGDGYAVGAGGVVLADGTGGWQVVLADGPGAASATLRGVDATDDGAAVWIAGDGGTVARIDTETDRHLDFTPPAGRTDNVTDVATAGPVGDEVVLLVNGSGEVLRGRYRDGDLAWDDPVKPGSGSSVAGVALADGTVGYVCDTNDGVFETTDGGESFRRVGVESVDGTPTDVATAGRDECTVSTDDGVLHRYEGETWTPVRLDDEAVAAITFGDGGRAACGGRTVYERAERDADWERSVTAAPGPLAGVALGPDRAIAVGSDGGILERS